MDPERQESAGQDEARPTRPSIGRREFLSLAGVALLSVATGCDRVVTPPTPAGGGTTVVVSETTPPAGAAAFAWRPFGELSTVAVATDAAAGDYPALTPGDAFDAHPAIALLARSLVGLGGSDPVASLRTLVREGDTVLVKPNWVEPASWQRAKITHPSLVLALAMWAAEAVGERGRVLVAEGTSESPDLPRILAATGFERALAAFRAAHPGAAPVTVVDLNAASTSRRTIDLGGLSRFAERDGRMYDAHGKSMGRIGDGRVGRYLIAQPVLDADLVIDVAKAKVHSSAGVTLAMKNLLGIVPSNDGPYGDGSLKDVPHYSAEDAEAQRRYVRNGTIGYSAADLTAVARYAARDGSVQRSAQRGMLCVVDGVQAGQASQFTPEPVRAGWIVAGTDPLGVDQAATRCMGFDPARVLSLAPARVGTLALGVGDASRVRLAYSGAQAYDAHFSARRALKPELARADWSGVMSLASFAGAAPRAQVADGVLSVRVATPVAAVRLESAEGFVALAKGADGVWTTPLPAGAPVTGLRLAATDTRFGHAEVRL